MLKKAASKISNLILPVGVFVFLGIYAFLFILHIPNDTKLTGVTLTEYPEETEPSAIMNGSFQNALGNYITEHFYGYLFCNIETRACDIKNVTGSCLCCIAQNQRSR